MSVKLFASSPPVAVSATASVFSIERSRSAQTCAIELCP